MEYEFIKGLELSEIFYREAVHPILEREFPGLVYSAALLGPGSDVLGFDTAQSRDHDWGPRLTLFLSEADYKNRRDALNLALRQALPVVIRGYPTNFGLHEDGTAVMVPVGHGPVNHKVGMHTLTAYFTDLLHFDPSGPIGVVDWISLPENQLLMATGGAVFHDGLGRLNKIREKLAYYPHDLWLYLMAAQWRRIAQEETFMGRCGQVGDELGSALIAARQARDLMRLCFLMERRYAPYIKWFGSAFGLLDCAGEMGPLLAWVLAANSWQARQDYLTEAYGAAARMHNALGITPPLAADVSPFYSRPFLVIHADRFADALKAQIKEPEVAALPPNLGSFDQFVDSTDAQTLRERFKMLFQA